jgi:hypothetical protein
MKLTHIIPTLALFVSSLTLVSCGDKGNTGNGGAEGKPSGSGDSVAAMSHADIGKNIAKVRITLLESMAKIKDLETAKEFAASTPEHKTRMKDLLEAAKALPAPTDEEMASVKKMMDAPREKALPAIMKTMMGLGEKPDGEAIGKIMQEFMEDKDLEKVVIELEDLYSKIDLKTVREVMKFLRNAGVQSGPYEMAGNTYFNHYSNFAYEMKDKSLSITGGMRKLEKMTWQEQVIYLETVKPAVQMQTVPSSPEIYRVALSGKAKRRTATSKDELANAAYEDVEDVSLLVSEDMWPRLKKALEDLLKASGVEVIGY